MRPAASVFVRYGLAPPYANGSVYPLPLPVGGTLAMPPYAANETKHFRDGGWRESLELLSGVCDNDGSADEAAKPIQLDIVVDRVATLVGDCVGLD